MSQAIIQARGISKRYDGAPLFSGLDLDIEPGQAVAFVGHNGSGKTTLLRMLAGLVKPTTGTILRTPKLAFAYVPEHFPKTSLTAEQFIRHMGRLNGLDASTIQARSAALFEALFMDSMRATPMKFLSKGSLQKVGVIQALLSRCDVLLLDEPLSGQDAPSQRVFLQRVLAEIASGTAVLLSCHEPFLVRQLADVAFELKDRALHALPLHSARLDARSLLHFQGNTGALDRGALPTEGILSLTKDSLRLNVPTEQCDAWIMTLLGQGLHLMSLSHEDEAL